MQLSTGVFIIIVGEGEGGETAMDHHPIQRVVNTSSHLLLVSLQKPEADGPLSRGRYMYIIISGFIICWLTDIMDYYGPNNLSLSCLYNRIISVCRIGHRWLAYYLVCGLLPKTLTLFMTKICDFSYPIYDLTTQLP